MATGARPEALDNPSDNGKTILSGGKDRVIRAYDVETGKEVNRWTGHTDRVCCLAVSPDGKRVASASLDESVRIWDFQSGKELSKGKARGKLPCDQGGSQVMAFSHDGRRLASGGGGGTVLLWDVTGAHLREPGRNAEALWEDLKAIDGAKAYRAVWQLADSPRKPWPSCATGWSL